MTIKQIKLMLRAIRDNRVELKELLDKREELQSRAEKTTQMLTGMPGAHDAGDKIGNYVSQMSELTGVLDDRIRNLEEQECYVLSRISMMPTGIYRTVLLTYYVTGPVGCTWDYVARQLNYSRDWVLRLHGFALQELKTIIQNIEF